MWFRGLLFPCIFQNMVTHVSTAVSVHAAKKTTSKMSLSQRRAGQLKSGHFHLGAAEWLCLRGQDIGLALRYGLSQDMPNMPFILLGLTPIGACLHGKCKKCKRTNQLHNPSPHITCSNSTLSKAFHKAKLKVKGSRNTFLL